MPEHNQGNRAIFLRKSKKGNHLFSFYDGYSLVMHIEDVQDLIDDENDREWVKVSVLVKKDE